jgi:hypothetical protein
MDIEILKAKLRDNISHCYRPVANNWYHESSIPKENKKMCNDARILYDKLMKDYPSFTPREDLRGICR